jgi:hypothetical protein
MLGRSAKNSMSCICIKLNNSIYLDDAPAIFQDTLSKISSKEWLNLHLCECCNQLWVIDEWDKYVVQVATKTDNKEDWHSSNSIKLRKNLLLESRGGTTDEECIWADCNYSRVLGVAYCINHLYDTGARR